MKTLFVKLCLIVVAGGFAVSAVAAPCNPTPISEVKTSADKSGIVEVDDLMKAPEKYPGTIRVEGLVRAVYPKEQSLGLLDLAYLDCCKTPCATAVLPVRWTGEMPRVRGTILVKGEVRRNGEKMEFVAQSIEEIAPTGKARK